MPALAVQGNLGHAVGIDSPTARLQADGPRERQDVRGSTAALTVTVDVERLDGIVDRILALQQLARRGVLMAELDHGAPDREHLFLVGHAGLDERALPGLQARHVLNLVGHYLDMAD